MNVFVLNKESPEVCSSLYVFEERKNPFRKVLVSNHFKLLKLDYSNKLTISESELCITHLSESTKAAAFSRSAEVSKLLEIAFGVRYNFVAKCERVFGLIDYCEALYLVLVMESSFVDHIVGHQLFRINKLKLLNLRPDFNNQAFNSKKLIRFLNNECYNFLFSFTYNLSKTLQMNVLKVESTSRLNFVINLELLRNFNSVHNNRSNDLNSFNQSIRYWTLFVVQGFFEKISFELNNAVYDLILLARKETQNTGTRYNRRGLNNRAFVANFVETEQIIVNRTLSTATFPVFSSYVQIRGSVPIYWNQSIGFFSPKPEIKITRTSESGLAFKRHFEDLGERYGPNLQVLSLLFLRENYLSTKSEIFLGEEYMRYFNDLLNKKCPCNFYAIDLKNILRVNKENLFIEINKVFSKTKSSIEQFVVNRDNSDQNIRYVVNIQKGVLRTNCVDCLDRTNVAKTALSLLVVEQQLANISNFWIQGSPVCTGPISLPLEVQSCIFKSWEELGDFLSMSYAGSKAHNLKNKDKTKNLVNRYIKNVFQDKERQNFFNVLVGTKECGPEFNLDQDLIDEELTKTATYNSLENSFQKRFHFFLNNPTFINQEDLFRYLNINQIEIESLYQLDYHLKEPIWQSPIINPSQAIPLQTTRKPKKRLTLKASPIIESANSPVRKNTKKKPEKISHNPKSISAFSDYNLNDISEIRLITVEEFQKEIINLTNVKNELDIRPVTSFEEEVVEDFPFENTHIEENRFTKKLKREHSNIISEEDERKVVADILALDQGIIQGKI